MSEPSEYINDICSTCNPQTYDMTPAKYVGQENIVEVTGEPDYSFVEYLYECCECGTRVWVEDDWVKRNALIAKPIKQIKQRQEYIKYKGRQLDKVTNANKYTHRLSRVMLYHKLLTDIEMDYIKDNLK